MAFDRPRRLYLRQRHGRGVYEWSIGRDGRSGPMDLFRLVQIIGYGILIGTGVSEPGVALNAWTDGYLTVYIGIGLYWSFGL
jgi:hypothetical protein